MNEENPNINANQGMSQSQSDFDPNRPRLRKIKKPKMPSMQGSPSVPLKTDDTPTVVRPSGAPPRSPSFEAEPDFIATTTTPVEEDIVKSMDDEFRIDSDSLDDMFSSSDAAVDLENNSADNVPRDDIISDLDLNSFLDEGNQLPTVSSETEVDDNSAPHFLDENDLNEGREPTPFMVDDMFSKKAVGIISLVVFLLGFAIAKMFFSSTTVVSEGLQGVVVNAEVPRGRARCGVAERVQGCVLYIMNPQRKDLNARDFYDLAAQLTGRQKFVIETANMRYSNTRIRPGNIAQINIPPLQ